MPYVLILSLIISVGSCRNSTSNIDETNNSLGKSIERIEMPSINEAPSEHSNEETNTVSVFYISDSGNFSEEWKLLGACSNEELLVKISYTTSKGAVNAFVPCVDGAWLFNEMQGSDFKKIQISHGGANTEMLMSNPASWTGPDIDCDPDEPYSWRYEMTEVFGSLECHAVAYCSNGRPYLYSDIVSTQCSYD